MGHISAFFYYVKDQYTKIRKPIGLMPKEHLSTLVINKKNGSNFKAISTVDYSFS